MKKWMVGIAVVGLFSATFGFQSAAELFQQALSKERVEGNLKEAISLYQKAIDLSKDDALSAKAQLQIGLCYEKMGLQEAEKAFRLVIDRYPGQAEAVKTAREKLARLAASAGAAAPAPAAGLTLRKLDIPQGIISPDGKYIASDEGETELFFYDIAARKKDILRKGKEGEKIDFLFSSVLWTTDSRRFAYVWKSSQEIDSLNIWDIADHSMKKVYENAEVRIIYLAGWEPSQKSIWAIYLEKDRIRKLGRFGVANGTLTEIMADKKFGLDVELSPDGQYLAMTYDGNSKIPDIRTLTTEGKLRSILLPCLNFERFLAWSPDGSNILFSSQRTGQNALWRLEVQDGQAVGEPVFITNIDGSIAYPGMTKNGTFYYSTFNLVEDAYTAKIDFPSGKTLQPERKIESESFGRTTTPFFSTDGKLLAYFFRKNVSTGPNMYDTLKVKDLEYGTMKEIPLDFSAQPTFMQLPRWSRDGKFIHLLGAKSGQRGLVRFDVATGQSELIAKDQGIDAWSSDGTIVYIVDRGPLPPKLSEQQVKIIRKKLDSSESKILYQGAVGEMTSWVRLSPDENWLSFNSHRYGVDGSGSLKIIPADPEITLTERGGLSFPEGMSNWTHDGKGLIQRILIDRKSRSFKLVYVSKLDPKTSGVDLDIKIESANIAVHPDGKTVAYTGQSASQEFWVLENFLPKK